MGSHFQSKILYCIFLPLSRFFLEKFQYNFPKIRLGSKAVWNFSGNPSLTRAEVRSLLCHQPRQIVITICNFCNTNLFQLLKYTKYRNKVLKTWAIRSSRTAMPKPRLTDFSDSDGCRLQLELSQLGPVGRQLMSSNSTADIKPQVLYFIIIYQIYLTTLGCKPYKLSTSPCSSTKLIISLTLHSFICKFNIFRESMSVIYLKQAVSLDDHDQSLVIDP